MKVGRQIKAPSANAYGSEGEYPLRDETRTFTTKFLAALSATSHLPSNTWQVYI